MPWAGVWDKSLIINFQSQSPDVGRKRKNYIEAADTCLQSLSGANMANHRPWVKCWRGDLKQVLLKDQLAWIVCVRVVVEVLSVGSVGPTVPRDPHSQSSFPLTRIPLQLCYSEPWVSLGYFSGSGCSFSCGWKRVFPGRPSIEAASGFFLSTPCAPTPSEWLRLSPLTPVGSPITHLLVSR